MFGKLIRYLILHAIVPATFLLAGWYVGGKFGAPGWMIGAGDYLVTQAETVVGPILTRGAEEGGRLATEAAADAGDYVVGTLRESLENHSDDADEAEDIRTADAGPAVPPGDEPAPAEPAAQPAPAAAGSTMPTGAMNGEIVICNMRVSNPPRGGDPAEAIGKAGETAALNGVALMLKPATKACLSSGFGYRNGKLHKGVDYFSDMGGDALAAGGGVIAEAVMRGDYGNMVVIDHGNGVYTRYAHLARFDAGVREGATVTMGQTLGPIGMTGASSIVHLHYEVLTGDIETNAGSFGLEPVDPFGL